jgi:predicted DNA binding CopG/RHH family protein
MIKHNNDQEEKELLDLYERGDWHSISNLQHEIKWYQESAAAWLEKNRFVYLTIPADDLEALKRKANQVGVPYQTLLTNIVHQFVAGER